MIEIDGSFGEGGGQIIRCAIAFSSITKKDVRIVNIRKNRPKPGLAAQHLTAIRAAGMLTDAEIDGMELGSTEVSFFPRKIRGGKFKVDIGTAGSISLLIQCLTPVAVFAKDKVTLDIKGGTDVPWSPPIDFINYVLVRALRLFGVDPKIELIERGYYPKGGGHVKVTINPSSLVGLKIERDVGKIEGISHASGLPEHVSYRQAEAAEKYLNRKGYEAKIGIECHNYVSTGSGITLWTGYKSGSSLGKKKKPAEIVGKEAAEMLILGLESESSVDEYLSDQLIPYMALSEDESEFTVKRLTEHTKTSIWVAEKFLDVSFGVTKGKVVKVRRNPK